MSHTYKKGPYDRANGHATQNAYKERDQGPHVSLTEEDEDERQQSRAGQPLVLTPFFDTCERRWYCEGKVADLEETKRCTGSGPADGV